MLRVCVHAPDPVVPPAPYTGASRGRSPRTPRGAGLAPLSLLSLRMLGNAGPGGPGAPRVWALPGGSLKADREASPSGHPLKRQRADFSTPTQKS